MHVCLCVSTTDAPVMITIYIQTEEGERKRMSIHLCERTTRCTLSGEKWGRNSVCAFVHVFVGCRRKAVAGNVVARPLTARKDQHDVGVISLSSPRANASVIDLCALPPPAYSEADYSIPAERAAARPPHCVYIL